MFKGNKIRFTSWSWWWWWSWWGCASRERPWGNSWQIHWYESEGRYPFAEILFVGSFTENLFLKHGSIFNAKIWFIFVLNFKFWGSMTSSFFYIAFNFVLPFSFAFALFPLRIKYGYSLHVPILLQFRVLLHYWNLLHGLISARESFIPVACATAGYAT